MVHDLHVVGEERGGARRRRGQRSRRRKRAAFAVAAFGRTRRVRGRAARREARPSARRSGRAPRRRGPPSNSSRRVSEAVGSEDPEREEMPLVGAAAEARSVPKFVRRDEERVGAQAEDVVDADGDVVGELEQGARRRAERLRLRARTPDRRAGGRRTRRRARAPRRSDRGRTGPAPPRPSAPSPRRGRARGRRGGARRSARTGGRRRRRAGRRRRPRCAGVGPGASTSISSDSSRS